MRSSQSELTALEVDADYSDWPPCSRIARVERGTTSATAACIAIPGLHRRLRRSSSGSSGTRAHAPAARRAGTRRGTRARPAAAAARTRSLRRPSPASACDRPSPAPSRSVATSSAKPANAVVVHRHRIARARSSTVAGHLVRGRDVRGDALDRLRSRAARPARDTARSVPSMCTASGITLLVVPARIFVIVIDDGIERVDAARHHHLQRLHDLGGDRHRVVREVRRRRVTALAGHRDRRRTSADAISAPPRVQIDPDGRFGDTCSANAASTFGVVEQPFVDHEPRAVEALLAGLEHEAHGARQLARRAASMRAAPTSIATCASWPHACIAPSTVARELERRCPRASAARPCRRAAGSPARRRALAPAGRRRPTRRRCPCGRRDRGRRARRATAACVRGSSSPSSGWRWMRRRRSTASGSTPPPRPAAHRRRTQPSSRPTPSTSAVPEPARGPRRRTRAWYSRYACRSASPGQSRRRARRAAAGRRGCARARPRRRRTRPRVRSSRPRVEPAIVGSSVDAASAPRARGPRRGIEQPVGERDARPRRAGRSTTRTARRPPSTRRPAPTPRGRLSGRAHTPSRSSAIPQPPHRVAQRGRGRPRSARPASTTPSRHSPSHAPSSGSRLQSCAGWRPPHPARELVDAVGGRAARPAPPCGSAPTRAVPSAIPNSAHHCTSRAPAARGGCIPSRRLAITDRAESGRSRSQCRRSAYYVLRVIC